MRGLTLSSLLLISTGYNKQVREYDYIIVHTKSQPGWLLKRGYV